MPGARKCFTLVLPVEPTSFPLAARRWIFSARGLFVAALVWFGRAGWSAQVGSLAWDELPPLPPSAGQARQPGVAGPFAGAHGDVLIVAGGANFSERMPWGDAVVPPSGEISPGVRTPGVFRARPVAR